MPHAKVSDRQRNRAKQLRQTMTRAETLLWRYLKAGHLDGLSFRRQVPMSAYIADFVCHSARLVVEIDGESHDFESQQQKDHKRDLWFKSQGYVVLRFTNDQVLRNLSGVVDSVRETVSTRLRCDLPSLSLPGRGRGNSQTIAAQGATPLPNPPPQGGREQAATRGKARQ